MTISKKYRILFAAAILLIASITTALIVRHQQKIKSVTEILDHYLSVSFCDRELFDYTSLSKEELSETVLHIAAYHGLRFPLGEDRRLTDDELKLNVRELSGRNFIDIIISYDGIREYWDEETGCYTFPAHADEAEHILLIDDVRQMGELYYSAKITYADPVTGERGNTDIFHFEVYGEEVYYRSVVKTDG